MNDQWEQVLDGSESWAVVHGDCLEVMRAMPDASVDAMVTDPPYDLTAGKKGGSGEASVNLDSPYGRARIGTVGGGFMNKAWDATGIAFNVATWTEALRVLRPGGHLLAFGATRTHHRMVVAIEDAGFEIRDEIDWIYGSGFPHSLDIGKALDAMAGAEREVVGVAHEDRYPNGPGGNGFHGGVGRGPDGSRDTPQMLTAPATDAAKLWDGWGTSLKPSRETICVARKPMVGTYVENILAHGTGALNIGACRVSTEDDLKGGAGGLLSNVRDDKPYPETNGYIPSDSGRWPSNLLLTHDPNCVCVGTQKVESDGHFPAARGAGGLGTSGHAGQIELEERSLAGETVQVYRCVSGCPVKAMDDQSGRLKSCRSKEDHAGYDGSGVTGFLRGQSSPQNQYGDAGGASRFFPTFTFDADDFVPFLYCAKPSGSERDYGCERLPRQAIEDEDGQTEKRSNIHPTVKSVAVMRWLIRLVVRKGGVVLDPFTGSGSTGKAAFCEGVRFIGIEQDAQYIEIARCRVEPKGSLL